MTFTLPWPRDRGLFKHTARLMLVFALSHAFNFDRQTKSILTFTSNLRAPPPVNLKVHSRTEFQSLVD